MHDLQVLIGDDAATARILSVAGSRNRYSLGHELWLVPISQSMARKLTGVTDFDWPDLEEISEKALSTRLLPVTEWLQSTAMPSPVALVPHAILGRNGDAGGGCCDG